MRLFILRCLHFVLRHITMLDDCVYNAIKQKTKERQELSREDIQYKFDEEDGFFKKIRIITHAGGGLQGMTYLNCKEAFDEYYRHGNRVFEYDVEKSPSDCKFLLSHNNLGGGGIDRRFTPIEFSELLHIIATHQDVIVIFDSKFKDKRCLAEAIWEYTQESDILERIVIQVFNADEVKSIRDIFPFKLLYVCMYSANYAQIARECVENQIYAVSIPDKGIEERVGWNVFKQCNICSFAYSVNTVDRFEKLRKKGITGVFSDFLYSKDVGRIEESIYEK